MPENSVANTTREKMSMSKTGTCEQAIRMYMDAMTEAMDNVKNQASIFISNGLSVTIHGRLLWGFTTDALVRTFEYPQKPACEAGTSPATADF